MNDRLHTSNMYDGCCIGVLCRINSVRAICRIHSIGATVKSFDFVVAQFSWSLWVPLIHKLIN